MARCPLCEHEQLLGDTCEVCGRALGRAGVVVPPTPPLEGLEANLHAPDVAPRQVVIRLADLEPNGAAPAPPFPGGPEPWLEATVLPAVAVAVEPLDVERTAGDGERSPEAALQRCRYCGELVPEGEAFCLGCAMHVVSWAGRDPGEEPGPARCRACGSLAQGARCPACGERLPAPEAS